VCENVVSGGQGLPGHHSEYSDESSILCSIELPMSPFSDEFLKLEVEIKIFSFLNVGMIFSPKVASKAELAVGFLLF
jgi:hypothetical protein